MPLPFEVQGYDRFITVDELTDRMTELSRSYPRCSRIHDIGRSTDGEPMRMMRIGEGDEQLLFIGCPHPNEPIGMLTIDCLARALIRDPELRGRYTWNLVLCADPDSTRLNEGWFAGPFTLADYASGFYRPPFDDQAILTFPFTVEGYTFLRPIAETRALMNVITALRPRFVASLHNAALGGGYFYLSPYVSGLGDPLRSLLSERSIPLALGEPELAWGVEPSKSIFECTTMRAHVEFLKAHGNGNPTESLSAGETTYGFSRTVCDPLFLISEVPYFADARISDESPTEISRRSAVIEGTERSEEMMAFAADVLDRVRDGWTLDSRFRRAAEAIIPQARNGLAAHRRWANDAPELEGVATVAQAFSNQWETPFYHALSVGVLRRALGAEVEHGGSLEIRAALKDVEERLSGWMTGFESAIDYKVVPIKDLVEVQLASALLCIEQL